MVIAKCISISIIDYMYVYLSIYIYICCNCSGNNSILLYIVRIIIYSYTVIDNI